MPRYNVSHNDKWACFSSVVDDFITEFMSLDEYEKWRNEEYGRSNIKLEYANKMDMEEALETIKMIHGEEKYNETVGRIEKKKKKNTPPRNPNKSPCVANNITHPLEKENRELINKSL